jgi:hypothetical protein
LGAAHERFATALRRAIQTGSREDAASDPPQ